MPRFDYPFDPNAEIEWDETCRYFTDKVPERYLLPCDPEARVFQINVNQIDEQAQRRAGHSVWNDPDHVKSKTMNLRARWGMQADNDWALSLLLFKRMMLRPTEAERDNPYLSETSAKEMRVLRNVLRHVYKRLKGIEEDDIEAIYQFCKYCRAEKEDNVYDIRLPIVEAIRRGEYSIEVPTNLQEDPLYKTPMPDNSYDFPSLRQKHLKFEKWRWEIHDKKEPIWKAHGFGLMEQENGERTLIYLSLRLTDRQPSYQ